MHDQDLQIPFESITPESPKPGMDTGPFIIASERLVIFAEEVFAKAAESREVRYRGGYFSLPFIPLAKTV